MESYKIGDYGDFEFTYLKNNFKGYFKGRAEIIDVDAKHIMLKDNDNFYYLTNRSGIRKFKAKEKTDK